MNGRVAGGLRSLSPWAVIVGLCALSAFAAASNVVPPAASHQSKSPTTSPYPRISIPRAVAPADGKIADRELFSPDEGPDLLVVVFVSTTCPIANAAIPELRRISEKTRSMKGELILVHPDPQVTGETVTRHDKTTRVHATSLLDPEHRLVSMLGATVVPEAFILERETGRWTLGTVDAPRGSGEDRSIWAGQWRRCAPGGRSMAGNREKNRTDRSKRGLFSA